METDGLVVPFNDLFDSDDSWDFSLIAGRPCAELPSRYFSTTKHWNSSLTSKNLIKSSSSSPLLNFWMIIISSDEDSLLALCTLRVSICSNFSSSFSWSYFCFALNIANYFLCTSSYLASSKALTVCSAGLQFFSDLNLAILSSIFNL